MRALILTLSMLCLSVPGPLAWADDGPPATQADAPSAQAPATVLEHHEQVNLTGARTLVRTVRWTVRIDDPARCAAGLILPPGLDGASDRGARVLEELLILPAEVQPGDTFTLQATTRLRGQSHSGAFRTAPDLPVLDARFEIRAPSWLPLHLWYDSSGEPTVHERGGRTLTVSWDRSALQGGQAVWSTWQDWLKPGEQLTRAVNDRMTSKEHLGRRLAHDIAHLDVRSVTERVWSASTLEPNAIGTWETAGNAQQIARATTVSAVDRGILLINLLRLAGHDAIPGWYRPAAEGGAFPVTVPAPAMLTRPVVVIRRPTGHLYIDPSTDLVDIPAVPASMTGATVWIPGDLPMRLQTADVVDGTVIINTNLNLTGDGSATWTASISASQSASEWIRALLAPLDEAGRAETLHRLVRAARPEIQRFSATTQHISRTDRGLRIQLSGHDEAILRPLGEGLTGEITPLLAPALAAWLPPNIRVRELMSINPPTTVTVLGVDAPRSVFTEEALLTRSYRRQGQRQILDIEVERPYRATTAGLDSAARRFLNAEATRGFELILVPGLNARVARSLQRLQDRTPGERAVLEAMLWWSARKDRRALRVLQQSEAPLPELLAGVERYVQPGNAAPWLALSQVAIEREEPESRLQIAESMARAGLLGPALDEAWELTAAPSNEVQALSLLLVERLQGPAPPEPPSSREAPRWQAPEALIDRAAEAAPDHPRVIFRRAEQALADQAFARAEALLESVAGVLDDASVQVLLAQAGAGAGLAIEDVRGRLEQALRRAPDDPRVVTLSSRAAAALGLHDEAARLALTAARMRPDDPQGWTEAVELSLNAGSLSMAAHAAQRASELDPESAERGHLYGTLATLLGDRDGAAEGMGRAGAPVFQGPWPPPLDTLLSLTPDHALYAVLVHHDAETIDDPRLLAMRTQMRLLRGHLDEAARDGTLLFHRHGIAEGQALAFAATAGRLYASTADQALDQAAAKDPAARLTRMEYRLVTGIGDPLSDARALDDGRAAILVRFAAHPAAVAAEISGWPEKQGASRRHSPPPGFRPNRLLSAAPGVSAWSDPDAAVAVLRVSPITGLLPPPLAHLYTPVEPPLVARPDGVQVLRLDGGVMPLFAAVAIDGDEEVVALGFTREAAERAMDRALRR